MGKAGCWTLIGAFLFCLVMAGCSDRGSAVGKEPVQKVRLVEDHSDILPLWAEEGVRDAVVVHIDAHDDIRAIMDPDLAKLRELVRRKEWAEVGRANTRAEGGLYDVGNFLFAGAKLGMIKEVYWIVPFPLFIMKDPSQGVRNLLRFCGFTEADIAGFRMVDGCFAGSFRGAHLVVCGIESLPAIEKPVTLSIDADFFPEFARAYGTTLSDGVRAVFGACSAKGYRVREAVVSYSVNGGFLNPRQRWVGEMCAQTLKQPGAAADAAAGRFQALQEAESAFHQGRYNLLSMLKPDDKAADASRLSYRAAALVELDRIDAGLAAASAACQADPRYCYVLPHLGLRLKERGRVRESLKFFAAGYAGNKAMNLGQADYGLALAASGESGAALAAFDDYRARNGAFPIDFVIAAHYLNGGEKEKGYRALQSALAAMRRSSDGNLAVDAALADAVAVVRKFCREGGHAGELKSIDTSLLGARLRLEYPSQWERGAGVPAAGAK